MYTVQIEKNKDEVHLFCGSKDKKTGNNVKQHLN